MQCASNLLVEHCRRIKEHDMSCMLMPKWSFKALLLGGMIIGSMAEVSAADSTRRITVQDAIDPEAWQPGVEHQLLDRLEGDWVTDTIMKKPGLQTTQTQGISSNRWILGGRFMEFSRQAHDEGPVVGRSILGFDEHAAYFSVKFDSLVGRPITARGDYDEENESIIFSGTVFNRQAGGEVPFRQILEFHGEDRFVQRVIVQLPQPGERELAWIEYTDVEH